MKKENKRDVFCETVLPQNWGEMSSESEEKVMEWARKFESLKKVGVRAPLEYPFVTECTDCKDIWES